MMGGFRMKGGLLRMAVMAVLLLTLAGAAGAAEVQSPEDPGHLVYPGMPWGTMRADMVAGVLLYERVNMLYADDLETGITRWTVPFSGGVDAQRRRRGGVRFGERHALVYSADGTASLLDSGTGREVWRRSGGFFGGGLHYAQLDAGDRWVTLRYETSAELCEVASGRRFKVSLPSGKPFGVHWMRDGKTVVLSELLTGKEEVPSRVQLWLWEPGAGDPVKGCAVDSPKKAYVFGALPDGSVFLREYVHGDQPEMLVSVINPRTGEKLRDLGDQWEEGTDTLWTEDGMRRITARESAPAVQVRDTLTGAPLFELTPPPESRITSCFQSAGKDWAAGRDGQNALFLMPVEENGAPRRILGDKRFLPGQVASIRPPHLLCGQYNEFRVMKYTLLSLDGLEERGRWHCGKDYVSVGGQPMLSVESGRLLHSTKVQSSHGLALIPSGGDTPLLEKPYRAVALSPDGRYLMAAVSETGPLFLLDETGKSLSRYDSQERSPLGPTAFSPDNRRVAVYHLPSLTVTDLAEGFPTRELTGQPGMEHFFMNSWGSLCFSPDGNLLLAGFIGGKALLFDANSGKLLHTFAEERRFRDRYVYQERFLSSLGGMAKDLLGGVTDRGKGNPALTCGFANNGTLALTIAAGQLLRAWSVHDGRLVRTVDPKLPEQRDREGSINNQIVLSPKGDFCLAYNRSGFGIASLWDTVGGQRLAEYRFPEGNRLGAVAVADDGKTVYAMINFDLHFLPGRK
jgi:WD40 repeat protein